MITATLGKRNSLRKTIESVQAIGGERVKHVIVCPKECIESIKDTYGNIECLAEHPCKKGIYAGLNYGFQTYGYKYKYLTFLNDDDHWFPDYKLLIDYIDSHRDVDMVYGRTCYIDEQSLKIGSQTSFPLFHMFLSLLKKDVVMLTQQATLITSELYFKLGGFDETYRLAADTKFWLQASILKGVNYHFINKECAAYMIQDGQLSSDHNTQKAEHIRLFNEMKGIETNENIALFLFRLYNLPIYIKRLWGGKVRNPFIK